MTLFFDISIAKLFILQYKYILWWIHFNFCRNSCIFYIINISIYLYNL